MLTLIVPLAATLETGSTPIPPLNLTSVYNCLEQRGLSYIVVTRLTSLWLKREAAREDALAFEVATGPDPPVSWTAP